jgi:tetratricopeptide (TPR) repeat protein
MRLLKYVDGGGFGLTEDLATGIPPYAILSHTWGPDTDEVTFKDLLDGTGKDKVGYEKLRFCAEQASRDGLERFWVDTCCIDKSDPIEVQRSINSMFRWYRDATRCYVYLSDVSVSHTRRRQGEHAETMSAFRASKWFTRGWTLQELLAPASVEFFSNDGRRLGDKKSLERQIHEITEIEIPALRSDRLSRFGVEERFRWAEKRETTYEEDWAYCLLGIFGVFLVPNYGEGKDYAVRRLRREIDEVSGRSGRSGRSQNQPNPSIVIPFGRDEDFVERPALLGRMSQSCGRPGSRTAIVGLGGVGYASCAPSARENGKRLTPRSKSQLAIEHAYRIRERSPETWVFWVHASNAARYEQGFREIAARVKIPGRHDPKADVFRLVHDWLADESKGRWVLVLDNLDDADFLTAPHVGGDGHGADEEGTNPQRLIQCLPQCQHGSVLVTSRSRRAASELVEDRDIIAVDPMDKEEALTLLRRKLEQHRAGDGTEELAAALEYMPLAIVQAAAYIAQTWPPCSVRQYLDRFRRSDRRRAGLLSYEGGKLRRDASAKNSILVTWQISFNHVREIRPSAIHLLSLMSFCDRQGIPASLLRSRDGGTKRQPGQGSRPKRGNVDGGNSTGFRWGDGDGDDDDDDDDDYGSLDDEGKDGFKDDIMTLRQFSFISVNKDGKTLEMHRLMQLATLEWLEAQGQQDHWRHRYLQRLCERLPTGEYENWGEWRALFPHAKSAMAVAPKEEQSLKDWATVLYKAAWYTWRKGNGAEAEKLAMGAMKARKKVLGPEQKETLDAVTMVALAYVSQGWWDEAEKLDLEVMETRKARLGADHPDTLTSMSNLASTYRNQARWDEAEKLDLEATETYKAKLGADHPDTLTSMANLASTFWNQGRWDEAEKLDLEVVETCKAKLGADHPDTLMSMANLASIYRSQGRWDEAEKLEVEVMETRKAKLGPDHPDTLTSIANLAATYGNQGRWDEAEKLDLGVMEIRKAKLGADHPDTLTSMNNLAFAWKSIGRHKDALDLIKTCYDLRQRKLGLSHPHTQSTFNAMTAWQTAEAEIHTEQ